MQQCPYTKFCHHPSLNSEAHQPHWWEIKAHFVWVLGHRGAQVVCMRWVREWGSWAMSQSWWCDSHVAPSLITLALGQNEQLFCCPCSQGFYEIIVRHCTVNRHKLGIKQSQKWIFVTLMTNEQQNPIFLSIFLLFCTKVTSKQFRNETKWNQTVKNKQMKPIVCFCFYYFFFSNKPWIGWN